MTTLKFLKAIRRKLAKIYFTCDSKTFVNHLRKHGVSVGTNVTFFDPGSNFIDLTRPYLISIGNKVKITKGVTILTHGFDWCVLRECYKRPFGSSGEVKIGNNIFIGINSIILKGVTIGDNSIIGAGSVVTSDIPENSVAGGNPAKVICSLDEYYKKRVKAQLVEASKQAKLIEKRLKRKPRPEDFRELFYLFLERDKAKFGFIPVNYQIGDYMEEFLTSTPEFNSFEEFLDYALSQPDNL